MNKESFPIRAMSKAELAHEAGVSRDTFRRWLLRLEPSIPGYRRNQRVLTPAQVRYIRTALCLYPAE